MYRVVCFMRIEADTSKVEPLTLAQAEKEAESQRSMQPADLFVVEPIDEMDVTRDNILAALSAREV